MSKWRLKQIEIENFKSYRGKQIIGPFKKFTAIVGPNGSGKSNLMDCISFVLGEQTKNLRVRRLNDLIHGAVVGRPVARSAYVRAVIENVKNGEEISYTRMVHNNSSEYKINGQSVKVEQYAAELEKIHIFMKVKNFLVFQGAVESIAMKNAKERCQMFEEISKSIDLKDDYDQAKADMLKAEEETAFNYHKKKGIAAERREAKLEKDEAERYTKLKKDLIDKQLDLQLFRLYYNEQELKNLAESLRERQEQLDVEQKAKRGVEDEMKEKRKDQTKLQREQTSLIQEIKQCEVKMSKKKPELLRVQQRLKHLSDKHADSKKSLANAKQAHETHLNEIDQLEGELGRIETLQEEYETQQNQASQAQGKSLDLEESQVKRYHLLKQKVAERTSHISAIVDNLTREYDEQKDAYEALERKKQEIVSSQRRKENELAETKKRHQKLCEYIESSTKAIQEQKKLETQIRVDVEEATKRIEEINGELESVVTQLGEAKVERHESSRAAKKQELIENLRRLFPGVYGRLIEMCEPSHRRYQVAITKVLGKYMEAIVCDSEKTAKDCIQYMKDQRIDPETFLPLDYLDIRPIDERLREIRDPPNVHLVIDVLQYDPPIIRKALQFACGNALVCETVEDARRVAYRTGERKKTVSLDGTLFQKSGVISGGATDLKARARRWDEKQINSLMAKREKLQEELKEALKKKRKEAELRTIQSQIKGLETRLKYTQKDKDSTEGKLLGTNEEEITSMREELESVEAKASRCQTRMQELQIVINDEKSKMDNVEDEVFGEFCKQIGVTNIREYEERELRIARDRDRKRLEFQNQLQRIKNQLEYEKSRDTEANVRKWSKALEDEKTESEKSKKQERRIREDIESEEVKKNELEDNLSALKRRSEKVDTELAEIRTRLAARQKDIQKVQKELNQVETRLENRQAERHSLLQTAKMEDIKLPFKRGSMEDIEDVSGEGEASQGETQDTQRIYEREAQLVLDYRRYLEKPLRSLDNEKEIARVAERMQTECDQMSLQLHRISAPNLRASDKLGTVEERLRTTEVEFDDARRRARKTKAHFEKIKRMRHERFMDCFNIVADHIDPIYKMLARNPGAQASLLPTNPEEPYLEEIQFQCVAPGKRFQQMDSLSGGEKTIAALALLFATHSYNSAPFFVLDEIDAALDNTNIGKVAAFIREYAEDRAQVIVISLKEEFYSRADSLVGIYPIFDDSCLISNVLSLDLTNYPDPKDAES